MIMCELSVYILGSEELVMEGVVRLVAADGKVRMENIFGEMRAAFGTIQEVDITSGKAFIAPS